ncbi:MAG: hypothetical protein IJY57_00835 [Clostridia bacterium]|nr:hypothetical protein [Clostridia bacterium]
MKLHLLEFLKKYSHTKPIRLHMPSHKGNKGFNKLFPIASIDITEIEDSGLYSSIEKAEKDLKDILGAKFIKIISSGASVGVLSMVYSVKDSGNSILINRSAHKSVYNALKLSGIEPIICANGITDGLPDLPTAEETAKMLDANKNAIGVLYTYPDYYGRTFDIRAIYNEVKKRNKLLLIDGAHGGHYAFIDNLVYAGEYADIWVDSLHKTASTLNQGALVLANIDKTESLSDAIDIFNTTSPNYPIIASCEYGIKELAKSKKQMKVFCEIVNGLKEELTNLGVCVVETIDPYKITIDLVKSGINEKSLLTELDKKKIYFELLGGGFITFMPSIKTKKCELIALKKSILEGLKVKEEIKERETFSIPKKRVGYLKSALSESEEVLISDAIGRVSAENAGEFPPCYPLIVCGEVVNKEIAERLMCAERQGKAFGVKNGKIKVRKIKNER